jgi:hypothetical protein
MQIEKVGIKKSNTKAQGWHWDLDGLLLASTIWI